MKLGKHFHLAEFCTSQTATITAITRRSALERGRGQLRRTDRIGGADMIEFLVGLILTLLAVVFAVAAFAGAAAFP